MHKSPDFIKFLKIIHQLNKISKTELHKMGLLDRLLGPLFKIRLPSLKNVRQPFAKSVLIPLGSRLEQTRIFNAASSFN